MLSPYMIQRLAMKNGQAKTSAEEKADAKKKPIAKRSAKMKDIMKELKKLYPVFLKSHPLCEIKAPGCTGKATAVHHTEGRIGKKITDVTTFLPCCQWCNGYLENNDKWARDNGFKKSKF